MPTQDSQETTTNGFYEVFLFGMKEPQKLFGTVFTLMILI